MIRDFSAGNYRFIPSVFQYSAGAAADDGYEIERVRFDRLVPLAEGFALAAKYHPGSRASADGVLCLRAALTGGLQRGRLSRIQPALREDAVRMGHLRRHHQSGGAQQCLSGDRSAVRAVVLRVLLHASDNLEGAKLRDCRWCRSARGRRHLCRAHRALPRPQSGGPCARRCGSPRRRRWRTG